MLSRKHTKIILSLLLLAYVARSVDFVQLGRQMASIPLWTVVVLCAGYFLGQVLSSFKWWLLTRNCQLEVSYGDTFRIYFAAMFVNLAGIGTVGGDMLRGVLIGNSQAKRAAGIATVVADRAHGLAVLAGLGTVCVGLFANGSIPVSLAIGLCALGFIIMSGWFLAPRILLHVVPEDNRFRAKIVDISNAFPTNPRTIFSVTVISLLFHLLQISLHLCMAWGLGIDVSMTTLLTIVPFVNILSSLPISWQGLGVRENAYRFFFVPAICSAEQAVAFGALWLLAVTVSALIGGGVGMLSGSFGEPRYSDSSRGEDSTTTRVDPPRSEVAMPPLTPTESTPI